LHPYSLDFACLETRLAIEVDGEAHDRGDQPQRDARRDAFVESHGFATLRLPAREVFRNLDGVLMAVLSECETRGPLHHPAAPGGPPPRAGEDM